MRISTTFQVVFSLLGERRTCIPERTLSPASIICVLVIARLVALCSWVRTLLQRLSALRRARFAGFLNVLDGCVNLLPAVLWPLLLRELGRGWITFTSASAGAHVRACECLVRVWSSCAQIHVISGIDSNTQAGGLFVAEMCMDYLDITVNIPKAFRQIDFSAIQKKIIEWWNWCDSCYCHRFYVDGIVMVTPLVFFCRFYLPFRKLKHKQTWLSSSWPSPKEALSPKGLRLNFGTIPFAVGLWFNWHLSLHPLYLSLSVPCS